MDKELIKNYKIGDWVRNSISRHDIGKIEEFTSEGFSKTICLTHNGHCFLQWEPWEPQPEEWCWFWNNDKQPFLAQLESIDKDEYTTVQGLHGSYADMSDACFSFEYCQPFIGELPTILQQPE